MLGVCVQVMTMQWTVLSYALGVCVQVTTMQWRPCCWRRLTPTSATPSPGPLCSRHLPTGTLRQCCAWCSMAPPGATRLTAMSSRPCAASPPSSEPPAACPPPQTPHPPLGSQRTHLLTFCSTLLSSSFDCIVQGHTDVHDNKQQGCVL